MRPNPYHPKQIHLIYFGPVLTTIMTTMVSIRNDWGTVFFGKISGKSRGNRKNAM